MNSPQSVLIIGLNFPEPKSSAAGSRMMQLLKSFKNNNWKIHFATPAQTTSHSENLEELGIEISSIFPNDPKADKVLKEINPDVVIFDRFMMEEQFGWRVAEVCPQAIRILDTEDLHFLRYARHQAKKENRQVEATDLFSTSAKREIAAILRCDISLIISEVEKELLIDKFKIDKQKLWYLPFLFDRLESDIFEKLPNFEARKDIIFIGNYLHAPNYDAALYLKQEIWPILQKKLPQTKMLIYGAYPPQKLKQLENKSERFIVKGRAAELEPVFQSARLLLAPLRFGAGLKGKVFDGIRNGTPTVTTSIGAEGVAGKLPFCGTIENTPEAIINSTVKLYTDSTKWKQAQENGREIMNSRFDIRNFEEDFMDNLSDWKQNQNEYRATDFYQQLLMHHSLQSTKYMSRWIEAKNKLN